jgi:hypothetical protein
MLKTNINHPSSFEENQRFTQWWMWGIILLPFGIALKACYDQFVLGVPFGNKPMTNTELIFFTLFGIGFAFFFWINQLKTKIDHHGIHVHFFPYTKRTLAWGEVDKCQVIPYGFVGGWGMRLWTQYGTVYNVRGGKGLYVQLKNKKKFLVGTQQAEELERFITVLDPLSQVVAK